MAINGGHHFEMPLKLKIIKLSLFLKSMHKHTQFTNAIRDFPTLNLGQNIGPFPNPK